MQQVVWFVGFGIGVGQVVVVEWLYVYYCVDLVVVDVEVVDLCQFFDVMGGFFVVVMDFYGQVEIGGVDCLYDFFQVLCGIMYYVQYWVEVFFFQFVDVVDFECDGSDEVIVQVVWYFGFGDQFVGGFQCGDVLFQVGFGFGVDYWVDVVDVYFGWVDFQFGYGVFE